MRLEEFLRWKYLQNRWTGNPDEIETDMADRLLKKAKKVEKYVELSDNLYWNLWIVAIDIREIFLILGNVLNL